MPDYNDWLSGELRELKADFKEHEKEDKERFHKMGNSHQTLQLSHAIMTEQIKSFRDDNDKQNKEIIGLLTRERDITSRHIRLESETEYRQKRNLTLLKAIVKYIAPVIAGIVGYLLHKWS